MSDSSNRFRLHEVVEGALLICNVISEKDVLLLVCSRISICLEVLFLNIQASPLPLQVLKMDST